MSVTIGATWAGVETVASAGDKAVGIYNAGGASSEQALIDAAIGVAAAVAALAEKASWGSIAAGADVVNSLAQLQQAIDSGNQDQIMLAVVGAVGSVAGLGAAVLPPPYNATAAAISVAATVGKQVIQNHEPRGNLPSFTHIDPNSAIQLGLLDPNTLLPKIDHTTNTAVTSALNWLPPRRDPLVLDLDGGGITTSGINTTTPIYFDQDADGVKTATGWIASGEAIVVRDLNGNGLIDSGRELFGDNTVLTRGTRAGQLAANGFEALADLDSDISGVADGKFDAADTAFSSVKLWKDTNQNGISETAELFTFAQLGVASINVAGTASNVDLGGGNTQTVTGSFTRTGGTVGGAGTAHLAGSLLLANNNFYREFTDDPALTTAAQALPQMTGSGAVRDLRPAMSLGTAQAASLQTALGQPLSPGMNVTAEIRTGKRRVIEFCSVRCRGWKVRV